MINVFKNRTRLYALTTSAFFFLQGADVSMGASWFPLPSLPSFSSLSSFLPSFLGKGSSGAVEPKATEDVQGPEKQTGAAPAAPRVEGA